MVTRRLRSLIPRGPAEPVAPLEADDARVVAVGTGLWLVALVVVVALAGRLDRPGQWAGTCLAGIALGAIGLAYLRRRTRRSQSNPSTGRTSGTKP